MKKFFLFYVFICLTNFQAISGIIEGLVCSASSSAIADVYVRIAELNLYCITDKNGYFRTDTIPEGIYSLEFNHIGYNANFIEDIAVPKDGITNIDTVFLNLLIYNLDNVVVTAEGLDPARQNNSLQFNTVS